MKEMQLFEVGLKEKYHRTSYYAKSYVVATNDLDARSKFRRWMIDEDETDEGWFDTPEEYEEYIDLIANLVVAKITHIGSVIV